MLHSMSNHDTICPGRYCGRSTDTLGASYADCSACPSGFRTNSSKFCEICTDNPTLYEWMYLVFMFTLPLFLNWLYIGLYLQHFRLIFFWQLLSTSIETGLAIIVSLLLFEPQGSLHLASCRVRTLSDWYTLFYNPRIKYSQTLHCAQEAVFPLYSIVFVCYLFSLLFMIFIRPFTCYKSSKESTERKQRRSIIYASLYFHPVLVVIHSVAAGLIYYSYPYLIIVITLLAFTSYCTVCKILNWRKLFKTNSLRHWLVITWHLMLLGYAEIAIANAYPPTQVHQPNFVGFASLPVVIIPTLFLLITEKCSHPNSIEGQLMAL